MILDPYFMTPILLVIENKVWCLCCTTLNLLKVDVAFIIMIPITYIRVIGSPTVYIVVLE